MKRLALLLIPALLSAAALGGCIANDDGDTVMVVTEVEPNDAAQTATQMGGRGSYGLIGGCVPGNDDWFQVESGAGNLNLTIRVQQPETPPTFAPSAPDVSVELLTGGTVLTSKNDVTEGAPATLEANIPAATSVLLKVSCLSSAMGYTASMEVP